MARQQYTDIYELNTTTLTNPWASAITITIVDTFSSVIITTTAISTAQTLPTPTNTTQIKRFTVINNDTSTHYIKINNETINPWTNKFFVWDWSSWTIDKGNVVWVTMITPLGGTNYFVPYTRWCPSWTAAAITASRLYYIPYRVTQQMTITSLNLVYTVWIAAATAWVGIYSSTDKQKWPTTLLVQSGAMAVDQIGGATVTYNLPTPLVILPNQLIWFAFVSSAAITIHTAISQNTYHILWFTSATSTAPNSHTRQTYVTPATLPNPASNGWAFTLTASSVPLIYTWITV